MDGPLGIRRGYIRGLQRVTRRMDRFDKPVVNAGGHDIPLLRTYGDVSPGDYLAIINSFAVVEIARSEQSASDGLGLERGAPVILRNAG